MQGISESIPFSSGHKEQDRLSVKRTLRFKGAGFRKSVYFGGGGC